jgi:glycosyltransferase involved in cell wall biosynthesis
LRRAGGQERRLFVAVPPECFRMDPATGAGRVWRNVLARLASRTRLRRVGWPARGMARLHRRRPDVWLGSGHEGPIRRDEPVVVVVHGSAWMLDRTVLDLVPGEFAEPFIANTEATVRSASFVIVPSEYTRRGLTDGFGFPEDRVHAVPHGVDAGTFSPSRKGGRALAAAKLGEDRPYVLFASIPSIAHKNLPVLKEAVARLAARGMPHALVIAGGTAGGEPSELLDEIAAGPPGHPGRVAWLGHVGDGALAGLMAEADAFCLPSAFEAFGLTALEAMACGAPVVVSNAGALPEVVADAGVLSDPTPEALEAALLRVLTEKDLAGSLRAAARARAEKMTWERTADGWLAVLRQAADEGRAA